MKQFWIGLACTLFVIAVGGLLYLAIPSDVPANTTYAYEYYYNETQSTPASEPEDIVQANDIPSYDTEISTTKPVSTEESEQINDSESQEILYHPHPVDTDSTSATVLVNHQYTLSQDYVPENLVAPNVAFPFSGMDEKRLMRQDAASALEILFTAAKEDGIKLYAISAYRSYARQNRIYLNYVQNRGMDYSNRYSAPPGHSEHQTGLAVDVSCSANKFKLNYHFAELPEGQWLLDNAHHYGFIIRYQKGKEAITGYAYEPWHIRFVGTELSEYLYANDLTLDEYYGVSAEDYTWDFDFNAAWKLYKETEPITPPTQVEEESDSTESVEEDTENTESDDASSEDSDEFSEEECEEESQDTPDDEFDLDTSAENAKNEDYPDEEISSEDLTINIPNNPTSEVPAKGDDHDTENTDTSDSAGDILPDSETPSFDVNEIKLGETTPENTASEATNIS